MSLASQEGKLEFDKHSSIEKTYCYFIGAEMISHYIEYFRFSTTPFAAAESVALINHLSQIYARYKRFNVNPAEFACMKAIVLFKSGKPILKKYWSKST